MNVEPNSYELVDERRSLLSHEAVMSRRDIINYQKGGMRM